MKQHHLSTKFLRFYILIGILGFFLITLGGSYMVEKHLEHSLSAALYTEAHNIASNEVHSFPTRRSSDLDRKSVV